MPLLRGKSCSVGDLPDHTVGDFLDYVFDINKSYPVGDLLYFKTRVNEGRLTN